MQVDAFVARWVAREGGAERANYQMFLAELCDVLGVPRPEPAGAAYERNDYVFERSVKETARDGTTSVKRIDLYKRDSFILEAKQSRFLGEKTVTQGVLPTMDAPATKRGRRGADRAWDVLMHNARTQAENYVRLLPVAHEPPPFVLVCDVGHCIEVYANFRRDGKAYDQFPDRRSFRVYLEDLRDEAVRDRLRRIWTEPMALDPSRHAARVTRDIAERLAKVSVALEKAGHAPEDVAMFLMRLLFTMFAEDVDLLPKDSFKTLLKDCVANPSIFPGMLEDLWRAMDEGTFSAALRQKARKFNGEFFKNRRALPLPREEIGELLAAAARNWREVEPAIFGTLLEQALDPTERRRLGAHYTPRAYVERLVIATVIDPLRADWAKVLSTAERQKAAGRGKGAIATVQAFHDKLCETRVLDPACGTGNFLYVSLELMKRLEGEVLEAIADLGGQEALTGLASHTVDPHQFLGMELNPRAAAIAELVLWIGHLQWHVRTKGGEPGEPILRAFHNIKAMDAVLTWDGCPQTKIVDGRETYQNPRRPDWPKADFIVGNPPFVGGKDLRARMPHGRVEALWTAHKHMNESADFVMYWWDRAAEILLKKGSPLRRFGFVTTNSISQVFQRRVTEKHLTAKKPLSIVMAIPDHPWTKQTRDAAAVRIAMTVAEAGKRYGLLSEVISEASIETDAPVIGFRQVLGTVNSDLTVGVNMSSVLTMRANEGLSSRGMMLFGSGFVITREEAKHLGLGRIAHLEKHIRPYVNGRDVMAKSRGMFAIDLFGLTLDEVRQKFPAAYQHLLVNVKPERDENRDADIKRRWWLFGRTRDEIRPALVDLPRYIATVETAKHRVFQFFEAATLPDNKLVVVASGDAFDLGVLASRCHVCWSVRTGGWLGVGNDSVYVKSRCFAAFPFPNASEDQKCAIRAIAEDLDAHRKRVLTEHTHLTVTRLYNIIERLHSGTNPADLDPKERLVFDDGLVLILKELHDRLDVAVADAYGWPVNLSEEELLARLVGLNYERAKEEKRGLVRWLRPDYQIPRFGSEKEKAEQLEADLVSRQEANSDSPWANFPKSELEQTVVVMAALAGADGRMDADAIAARFRGRNVRSAVNDVLIALYRMGHVSAYDGGRSFALRRAA